MALLVLDGVWKRFPRDRRGRRECVALRDVQLEIDLGEIVAVVGRRRSGRTSLLEVAAGLEPPSEGRVRFDDVELSHRPMLGARDGIGFCTVAFEDSVGDSVLEHVAAPLLAWNWSQSRAKARAHEALRRVDAVECAALGPEQLDPTETIRVAIARALVTAPRLVLLDEPALGVSLSERDRLLGLVHSIARQEGSAVLMTVDSGTELAGCDRAASLDSGELRIEAASRGSAVIPLRPRRAGSST